MNFSPLKKSNNSIKNNSFSLIDSNVSRNQNTIHKTKSISYYNSKVESEQENKEKKKRLSRSDPFWRWGGGRGTAAKWTPISAGFVLPATLDLHRPSPSLSLSLCCVLSPSLFYFLWCDKRVSARLFQLEAEMHVLKPKIYIYVRLVRISKLLLFSSFFFRQKIFFFG